MKPPLATLNFFSISSIITNAGDSKTSIIFELSIMFYYSQISSFLEVDIKISLLILFNFAYDIFSLG